MPFSDYDDVIDSRDIIARIEEIEGERDEFVTEYQGRHDDGLSDDEIVSLWAEECPDDAAERDELLALVAEIESYADDSCRDGVTLIRDSYFTDYAQELAEDIGAIPDNVTWPLRHIDWEAAADELLIDYSGIDFRGTTYYVR